MFSQKLRPLNEREVYIRAEEYAQSNERPGPAKIFERMIKDKIELGVKDMYVDIKIAKAVHKRFLDSPEVQKPIPEKTASPEGKLFCRFSHTTPKYVFWFFFSEDQQKVISDFHELNSDATFEVVPLEYKDGKKGQLLNILGYSRITKMQLCYEVVV